MLDYIPSWLEGAKTLLQKINLCIEKVETLDTTIINNKTELLAELSNLREEINEKITLETSNLRSEINNEFIKKDANDLIEFFEGSDTVVVDVNESGDKIEIHLDGTLIAKIDRAILTPITPVTEDSIPVIDNTGAVSFAPLSSLGGGGKVYVHKIKIEANYNDTPETIWFYVYSSTNTPFTFQSLFNAFQQTSIFVRCFAGEDYADYLGYMGLYNRYEWSFRYLTSGNGLAGHYLTENDITSFTDDVKEA